MKIQLNLLPPEQKKEQRLERYRSRIISFGWIGCGVLIVLLALYSGVYFLVYSQYKSIDNTYQKSIVGQKEQQKSALEEIQSMNRSSRSINAYLEEHPSFSNLFSHIEQLLPGDASIRTIKTTEYKIALVGVAKTREAFLLFEKNIKEDQCFEKYQAPLSNIFVQSDVEFQMEFFVHKECLNAQ